MASVLDYKLSGVDIDAGNELVRRIAAFAPAVGGFSGLYPIDDERVLVASTDGVGTKLDIAIQLQRYDTIGADLVAMVVNDIVTTGARPLFFLDYYATGRLDVEQAEQVVKGIHQACAEAGCLLLGGETAEMPGFYPPGKFDLAGFAVGMADRQRLITGERIQAGDVLLGIPSSGPHANGYSLIRRILKVADLALDRPFGTGTLGDALLRPTRIYVAEVQALRERFEILGLAHITGGGFENVDRMLPPGLRAVVDYGAWPVPSIFGFLQSEGHVADEEMRRTFNLGVGMVLAVRPSEAERLMRERGDLLPIGHVAEAA
jgi:phosphoribosylformylglycinamidine cyclo-ligase